MLLISPDAGSVGAALVAVGAVITIVFVLGGFLVAVDTRFASKDSVKELKKEVAALRRKAHRHSTLIGVLLGIAERTGAIKPHEAERLMIPGADENDGDDD